MDTTEPRPAKYPLTYLSLGAFPAPEEMKPYITVFFHREQRKGIVEFYRPSFGSPSYFRALRAFRHFMSGGFKNYSK